MKRFLLQKREKAGKSAGVDWKVRDEECLELTKCALKPILNRTGKPVKVTSEDVAEDIDSFRLRKIRWAIFDMGKKVLSLHYTKVSYMQVLVEAIT